MTCKSCTLPVYEMSMTTQPTSEAFSLQYCRRQCAVSSVRSGGFRVVLSLYPGGDEMWESLSHEVLFADKRDAERLADRVKKAPAIHLKHWVWSPSPCTPFARLQEKPTAKLSTVAVPSRHQA